MLDGDIRLKAARLMTDTDDGGGPMSDTEIISNQIGNLGVVVADLDRSRGFVFLRKVCPHVDTPDTEILYKSSLIIARPPTDPAIRSVLFSTGDWFDELADARAWVERYLIPGEEYPAVTPWNFLQGETTIRLIRHTNPAYGDVPPDGAVFVLRAQGGYEQYITVQGGASVQLAYAQYSGSVYDLGLTTEDEKDIFGVVDSNGTEIVNPGGTCRVVSLTLAEPITFNFPGRAIAGDGRSVPLTRLYTTQPGGRYYGIQALAAAAALEDTQILVGSLASELAPPDRTRLTGIDATRLPPDGRVEIFKINDLVVVHHTGTVTLPSPVTAGSTHAAGRTHLSRAKVLDFDGAEVTAGETTYTADLVAGEITFADANNLNLTGYAQPLTFVHRIEHAAVVTALDSVAGGEQITLSHALPRAFPADSYVSSALEMGNLYARVSGLFTQEYWTGAWSDERIGNQPDMQFNRYLYSIAVTNHSAIRERWALIFTSPTVYRCIGEKYGPLAVGLSISEPFAPLNPYTGQPLFVIPAGAFGAGGQTGNVFRFNTHAASFPSWLALTVLPGSESDIEQDSVELYIRGNSAGGA